MQLFMELLMELATGAVLTWKVNLCAALDPASSSHPAHLEQHHLFLSLSR